MSCSSTMNEAAKQMESCCEDTAKKVKDYAESSIKENPVTGALVTFGVGMGIGLLLTQLIPSTRRHHWYDNYISDQRARSFADSVMRSLPESISRRLG